ncbi:hypothetical protein Ahy_A10g047027 isoform C [Arachis hypogaea]|uniref:CFA20 domain-containing protein n=1 Tax=Arachis hypogaea TaxID=3818 RepID=A0A445B1C8_ARAHY|nr:hypothetical protein Ahy_A10g047027 isoform C [Arachis hypogaea]
MLLLLVQRMFKNTFQSGFLSILYSLGSKPLQIWDKEACKRARLSFLRVRISPIVHSSALGALPRNRIPNLFPIADTSSNTVF